jgi:hypothetical protein
MKIGRYAFRGFGGRKPGYTMSSETKKKISESVRTNNKNSVIYKATHKSTGIGKSHGDSFRMAFDETFGILYCDLKSISGACEAMK